MNGRLSYDVTLIPGDGIGPEVAEAARRVLEATGVKFNWDIQEAGEKAIERYGTPMPETVIESIKKTGIALKGPVTTPIGKGFRSVNVALRKSLDLYACVRPCKLYKGVPSPFESVDLVVVRENTEDLYAGVEFDSGSEQAKQVISMGPPGAINPEAAISIKAISGFASERIARYAFEYAVANGRKKVTAVAKANIMKYTDGLFYRACRKVAEEYKGRVEYEELLVDNACMQLVQRPEYFDVIVTPNLYGDILSDLTAGLVGGLGVAPGANIGESGAVFEATHGSVPQWAGQNRANPTALVLSGAMLLRHLGEREAALRVESAVASVIEEGISVTGDLKPRTKTGVGTREMTDAIIARL